MYYSGAANTSSPAMMQFPPQQQQQQFQHAVPTYQPQQQFIVQHPSQQNVYQGQNTQFVPMNMATPTSQQQYVSGNTNTQMYENGYGGSVNVPQANQSQAHYRHNRTQMVPINSADDRYRKQLIVNYLAADVTSSDLHSLFSQFGPLDGARIIYDRHTSAHRGYGFVYFRSPESAKSAVENMNGYEYRGKRLKVGYSTNPLNIISSSPSNNNYQYEQVK